MKKVFLCLVAALWLLGCATEVIEEENRYKVDSNVKPAPRINPNTMPTPLPSTHYSITPVEPTYPVTPVTPSYPSITPVEPMNPVVVTPPPIQPPMDMTPSEPSWMNDTVRAEGQCAINPAHTIPAQAKLMAKRGAIVDARRNLIEKVLGLRLDAKTVVRDMMTESDLMNTETSALIKNTTVTGENFDGSIYTVQMELKLYDFYHYMRSNRIYYK